MADQNKALVFTSVPVDVPSPAPEEGSDEAPSTVSAPTVTMDFAAKSNQIQPPEINRHSLDVPPRNDPTDSPASTVQFPNLTLDTTSAGIQPRRSESLGVSPKGSPFTPSLRRRAATFRTVSDYDAFEMDRPGWQPGAEPGFDPSKPDGGHSSMPTLSAVCDISVVDFSQERLERQDFLNEDFIHFLQKPQLPWSKCRWINVNGLSWDVIQAIGSAKGLHMLALEDIMDFKNRPKAEWYPTHAFVILTLQKLVHKIDSDSESSSDSEDDDDYDASSTWTQRIKRPFRFKKEEESDKLPTYMDRLPPKSTTVRSDGASKAIGRTLQQYHASPNEARTEFMEKHSSLADRSLAVSAEQVAIFLTSDNTIITFFEVSADDIMKPIMKRLMSPDTILRQLCDASMVMQAVIDAVIDLAIPLTNVYSDVLGDLELDVLTNPTLRLSRQLYIIISEMNKMLSFLLPIDNIIRVLRDHKVSLAHYDKVDSLRDPTTGIIITSSTATYLGDVLDHCAILTESMQQIRQSAHNLIDLIFNITSANQNESMKQLTAITIIFLPLTFITGFFGQNFQPFPELERGISYFWKVSVPTVFATVILIMFTRIRNYLATLFQRRRIWWMRKTKERRKQRRIKRRLKREKSS